MGLFARKAPVTAAQLGAANDPAAHDAGAQLVADPGRDTQRDELATVPDAVAIVAGNRFRLGSGPATAMHGPATDVAGADPTAHDNAGQPDARRQTAGYHGELDTATGATLVPEQLVNTSTAVAMREQDAPVRPRAGLTGADPARQAMHRLWTFLRPFDKGMADNLAPDGVGKLEAAGPLASLPISHDQALSGALPSAGGSGATGMDPVGVQPNSFRLLPRAWDEYLVNTGGPASVTHEDPARAASSAQARRGFRAGS